MLKSKSIRAEANAEFIIVMATLLIFGGAVFYGLMVAREVNSTAAQTNVLLSQILSENVKSNTLASQRAHISSSQLTQTQSGAQP
ncbi:MAG: hypothetical protein V4507_10815 [Verrucomicrobiota bacterium]